MGRPFSRKVNGKPLSYECFSGRHELQCYVLQCCCPCHQDEPVEDRNVTSQSILFRSEEPSEPDL